MSKVRTGFEEEQLKLFTIGDSVSQGFMSLAAARTDLAYSTLIARSLNLEVGREYLIPRWEAGGLPVNLEDACRRIEPYGPNIWGPEWLRVIRAIDDVVDAAEDHYESGPGAASEAYREPASAVGGPKASDPFTTSPYGVSTLPILGL